ncbi:GNAT family N-acetyltransferase [Streptomyces sp. NPDC050610]|uniref:GNAT family N-acetyltransferase n=1 Tax=Streptomyces sp. NPDC050610 TaxID=3157097 RepID=UPI003417C159
MSSQDHLKPRSATLDDIAELVRLRTLLLSSGTAVYAARNEAEDEAWKRDYRAWLGRVLTEAADWVHVAVIGEAGGLCACAIAVVDQRAPTVHCPSGRSGWVQTVVVDPALRQQGLGGLVMDHVLGWLRRVGADAVALQTTAVGTPLYRKLGFQPSGEELLSRPLGDDQK